MALGEFLNGRGHPQPIAMFKAVYGCQVVLEGIERVTESRPGEQVVVY